MKTLFEKMRDNRPRLVSAKQQYETRRKDSAERERRKRENEFRAEQQAKSDRARQEREWERARSMQNAYMPPSPIDPPTFPKRTSKVRAWFGWP